MKRYLRRLDREIAEFERWAFSERWSRENWDGLFRFVALSQWRKRIEYWIQTRFGWYWGS